MSALKMLPLPVRIALFFVVGLLIFNAFKSLASASGLFLFVAIVMWVIVALAALYDGGGANFATKVPGLSNLLAMLTKRKGGQGAPEQAHDKSKSARELTDEEREQLFIDGREKLDSLVGVDDVVATIEQRLLDVAHSSRSDEDKGFGTKAPALVVALSGPDGVGKEEAASALAMMYAGMGSLKSAKVVSVKSRDIRAGGSLADVGASKAQAAAGGTLYLENADWLLEGDPYGGPAQPGVDFGLALLDAFRERPQETLVIMSLSASGERKLVNDAQHQKWLGKLAVRSIPFDHLDDEDLVTICEQHLALSNAELDDDALRAVRNFIKDERARLGDEDFDNADAARRCAEKALEAHFSRTPPSDDETVGPRRVTKEDIQIAMNEY